MAQKDFIVATDAPDVYPDGMNDSAQGIQDILDRAKGGDGVYVVFPAGEYKLDRELIVYSNTTIEASLGARFEKVHNGSFMLNCPRYETYRDYEGNGNITIDGGVWDCNAPAYSGGTAFPFIHAENIYFKNMTMLDNYQGHFIEFNAIKNIHVDNCHFKGYYDPDGSEPYEEAIQFDLAKGDGVAPWYNGVWDHTPCKNIVIENCYFGDSDRNDVFGRAIGSHSSTIGYWHENITIKNNIINGTRTWGVRIYSSNNVVIDGNSFFNCSGAITVDPPHVNKTKDIKDENGYVTGHSQDCHSFVITNNLVEGGGSDRSEISLGGEKTGMLLNITATGNQLRNCDGNQAFYVANCRHLAISDNTMVNVGKGIYSRDGEFFNFQNNIIHNTDEEGIKANGGIKYLTVSNNQMQKIGERGVHVIDVQYVNVSGNMIAATGTHISASTDRNGIRLTTCREGVVNSNILTNEGGFNFDYPITVISGSVGIAVVGNATPGPRNHNSSKGGILANNIE